MENKQNATEKNQQKKKRVSTGPRKTKLRMHVINLLYKSPTNSIRIDDVVNTIKVSKEGVRQLFERLTKEGVVMMENYGTIKLTSSIIAKVDFTKLNQEDLYQYVIENGDLVLMLIHKYNLSYHAGNTIQNIVKAEKHNGNAIEKAQALRQARQELERLYIIRTK